MGTEERMMIEFDRRDLADMRPEELAPLEALMAPEWPDTWRDLATSQFVTLLCAPGAGAVPPAALARLAVALTLGIAQDLGGTQPYIPVGADVMASARAQKVVELLGRGLSYKQVADATGITESRVRNIERGWRREQIAARQGRLALDD